MTRKELAQIVSVETGLDAKVVEEVISSTINTIKDQTTHGENVYLRGFGTFSCVTRAARKGRNITKGTICEVPERTVPKFKPGKDYKREASYNK